MSRVRTAAKEILPGRNDTRAFDVAVDAVALAVLVPGLEAARAMREQDG
jgi:hypothetical protein